MSLRKKDYFLVSGLGVAMLLFLNILWQISFPKKPRLDIQLADEIQIKDFPKPAEAFSVSVPVEAGKVQFARLELIGTLIGHPSMAFIYNPQTQSSALYKENDSLEGAKISQILPGKIILEKGGMIQELFLTSRRVKMPKDNESFVSKDEFGTMIISKMQMLGQMFKAHEIMAKVKIMPLADAVANKLKGFKIENVPAGSIIEEAGIENGDIIYSVQGQRLQSMQDALVMFNRILNQSRIEVVLLRNDQPVTLKYEIH